MFVESFLKYIRYEKNYSSHTVLSYNNDLLQFRRYIEETTGGFDPINVDACLVRGYISLLMEEGIVPRSVGRKLSTLRTFYKYLIKMGQIKESPVATLQKPREGKRLPVFVRQTEMDDLLNEDRFPSTFLGIRDRLILSMLYQTGMRRAELISLQDSSIDFSASIIKVTGKRDKQRIIPFGEELKVEIGDYMDIRAKEVGADVDAFFVRNDGRRLYPGLVYRIVTAALAEVTTLSKRSPHVLRHSFASAMLNNGADIDSVKELLGHNSLASTQIYTHVTFEELKKSYNQAHPRAVKKGGFYGY
ncbi:MAG: tyrosine recombinase XerC [Bacteroidales bacterium]